MSGRATKEKICKAEQDCFGAPGTGWNFSQNWGFEVQKNHWLTSIYALFPVQQNVQITYTLYKAVTNMLSEFYIIIFLNKLKIVENTVKIKLNRL
jgi:hypothetical protein